VRRVSSRYIAGDTIDEALSVVRRLNDEGFMATLDVLGEFVNSPEEAWKAAEEYRSVLRQIHAQKLDSNVSLKLTQMGLKLDVDLCHQVTRSVVQEAFDLGSFVRLDMEDSTCTDDTLEVYDRLRTEFSNVGCVIQAYLKRSMEDVRKLTAHRANVRLCKGIYVESPEIAIKDPLGINANFERLLREMLVGGSYVGIATHDYRLVEAAYRIIEELKLDRSAYEFQMLLGVTEALRASILERGHRLRVYVPYGSQWYAYSLRRLKENPQIVGYAVKAMFNGGD
jgi:proline dehydrogenase